MQFLQYKDSNIWWYWPVENGLTVYNVNGGWHEIDENSEQFMCGRRLINRMCQSNRYSDRGR